MNRSVADVGGAVLVVSQFTLAGDVRRGRRPSFDEAAPPEIARDLYETVVRELRATGLTVATGEFQAMMRGAARERRAGHDSARQPAPPLTMERRHVVIAALGTPRRG